MENEFKKLQTFDSISFRGISQFENDGTQNDLVFQPTHRYFERVSNTNNHIYHGNLNDCLMKVLHLLLHLIIFFILLWFITFYIKSWQVIVLKMQLHKIGD